MRFGLAVLGFAILFTSAPAAFSEDLPTRQPLELPPDAKAIFLAQMLGHVVSLDAIVTAIANGEYEAAAGVARQEMAVPREAEASDSSPGLGFGEYLPDDFKAIGARFHEAANSFADIAAGMPAEPSAEEQRALIGALAEITHQCRDCHDSFRVQ